MNAFDRPENSITPENYTDVLRELNATNTDLVGSLSLPECDLNTLLSQVSSPSVQRVISGSTSLLRY